MNAKDKILAVLDEHGGWMPGLEIAKKTGMRGVVYVHLDTLVQQGQVEEELRPIEPPRTHPRHWFRITHSGRRFQAQDDAGMLPV